MARSDSAETGEVSRYPALFPGGRWDPGCREVGAPGPEMQAGRDGTEHLGRDLGYDVRIDQFRQFRVPHA